MGFKDIMRSVFDFFDETTRSSMIRLMSFIVLGFAIYFSFEIMSVAAEIKSDVLRLLIVHNIILYGFAFFPKVVQKIFERNREKIITKDGK